MTESNQHDDFLATWMFVSRIQYWLVLIFAFLSVLILVVAVWIVLRIKRSHYFYFLLSIVCADLAMLTIILLELLSQTLFPLMKGPLLCKAMHFFSNVAATFVNWTWVLMFVQRFALVFFPLKRVDRGVFGVLNSSKKLLLINLAFSSITQSWALLLITEKEIEGGLVVCERDARWLSERGFQMVAVGEAVATYVLPFLATLATDLTVLMWNYRTTRFTLVTTDGIKYKSSNDCEGFKIQSSKGIESRERRRQAAIRRCLAMATIQAALNAPHYALQVIDELCQLSTSRFAKTYYYMDAVLYQLYLMQFPIVILYIYQIERQTNANTNSTKMTASMAHSTTALCPPVSPSPHSAIIRSSSHRFSPPSPPLDPPPPKAISVITKNISHRHSFRGYYQFHEL
ncbi:unnamed protein product, partial [Mesorhabditis belari]|uniref:G-protein coupled receptors family 1 profile domain-containing protein n=1 Tax=Mesorhabditis belari TaxID=2138241 RepID=A0AAF3JBD1_9BILA